MKKLLLAAIALVIPVMTVIAIVIAILSALFQGANEESNAMNKGSVYYVKHWSTGDPYTHDLMTHRYGITAEQLDGYLQSTGIKYDSSRINGKTLLRWEASSHVDVRAIVAIAQWESGFGTAGVATTPGANMFGYGAFDSNPDNATNYSDEIAIVGVGNVTIVQNLNRSFKIQDDKAQALANGTWIPLMGGVYFTSTAGVGKKRADTMAAVDKWIDDHGGTPDPPAGSGGAGVEVLDAKLNTTVPGDFGGVSGACYAVSAYYAHSINPTIILRNGNDAAYIGRDYTWSGWGWTVVSSPSYEEVRAGDIINFLPGGKLNNSYVDGTSGHTGVVGGVLGNKQILLYDQNPGPLKLTPVVLDMPSVASIIHPPSN